MISGSVDNVISAAGLPYLFGMRLLYPGFSKLVSSFNPKRPGGARPEGLGRGRCTALVLLLPAGGFFPVCAPLRAVRTSASSAGAC